MLTKIIEYVGRSSEMEIRPTNMVYDLRREIRNPLQQVPEL